MLPAILFFRAAARCKSDSVWDLIKTPITIQRYAQLCCFGQPQSCRLSGMARQIVPMRHARAVLQELVLHVQPPKGCAIVLTERPFRKPSDPNWVATVGPIGPEYTRRYTAKVAELRQTDLRIDWSDVTSADEPRRIALRHSELIGEPV
jgi:hypothetical protein